MNRLTTLTHIEAISNFNSKENIEVENDINKHG
jgi:hypothetical protein